MFLNYAASTKHSNSLAHPISIPQLGKSLHAVTKFSHSLLFSTAFLQCMWRTSKWGYIGVEEGRQRERIVKDAEETAYFKITR